MKRKLLSFLILAFYTQAYSQNSEEFIPSDAHSPNAAELSSYGLAISLSALPLRAQRIVNNISAREIEIKNSTTVPLGTTLLIENK